MGWFAFFKKCLLNPPHRSTMATDENAPILTKNQNICVVLRRSLYRLPLWQSAMSNFELLNQFLLKLKANLLALSMKALISL